MGRFARSKGRRGEHRACDYFEALGWKGEFGPRMVSPLETTGKYAKTLGWDVELPDPLGGPVFKVQVKEMKEKLPGSVRSMFTLADILFVHYTTGPMETRTFTAVNHPVMLRFLVAWRYLTQELEGIAPPNKD